MDAIKIIEHQTIPDGAAKYKQYLEEHNVNLCGVPEDYMGVPKYLALDSNYTASYFIGVTWLVENELPLIVLPKIKNIDFIQMFLTALSVESKGEQEYFSKCYPLLFLTSKNSSTRDAP